MSDQVRIVEVGPRDGLQNEKTPVSAETRIAFIENLVKAGLHTIEVGSFVSPKAIPQMVNSDQVLRAVDLIVVPVVPSALSIRALEVVDGHVRGRVPLLPVHVMVDRRRRLHAEALAAHPDWPIIPMASLVEAMGEHRAPLGAFAPRSSAAQAYADLWRSVERRLAGG